MEKILKEPKKFTNNQRYTEAKLFTYFNDQKIEKKDNELAK